ncbi:hypothetical protein U2F58_03340 [Lactobacillus johnsonii]|uniref:Uncharacterized protein n=1 Tax=Lactobacillus johnsonii TaxID=33959 RepID=A0A9X0LY20_LACJH|nr:MULTISPECIES: hypothetical protein [Lactobacillus]KXN76486.1 hypothetical protein AYJ53_02960 [Lactobacillus johnsonii]MRM99256.1 hypothetical protein [Lactobacillus taiwanensis]
MEEEYLYVVAHQSELNETIKDISNKPQLSYFDDWDMKMRWLTALIETELKKAAYFGHHYLTIKSLEDLLQINVNSITYRKEIFALAKQITLDNVTAMYVQPKFRKEVIESYIQLKDLLKILNKDEAKRLKKYLCFKFESIISSCEIYSEDSSNEKIKIFFAW